jgi:hypothetical protein
VRQAAAPAWRVAEVHLRLLTGQRLKPHRCPGLRGQLPSYQPRVVKYRRTVMWLQPSSDAIRWTPQPSEFSRTIAATSSGSRIPSPADMARHYVLDGR